MTSQPINVGLNLIPRVVVPLRQHSSCLVIIKQFLFGLAIIQANCLTIYVISGRVQLVKYMTKPTMVWYMTAWSSSTSWYLSRSCLVDLSTVLVAMGRALGLQLLIPSFLSSLVVQASWCMCSVCLDQSLTIWNPTNTVTGPRSLHFQRFLTVQLIVISFNDYPNNHHTLLFKYILLSTAV